MWGNSSFALSLVPVVLEWKLLQLVWSLKHNIWLRNLRLASICKFYFVKPCFALWNNFVVVVAFNTQSMFLITWQVGIHCEIVRRLWDPLWGQKSISETMGCLRKWPLLIPCLTYCTVVRLTEIMPVIWAISIITSLELLSSWARSSYSCHPVKKFLNPNW